MSPVEPFVPMEPVSLDKPFDHPGYIYQIKWDGVRILSYYNQGHLQLHNRKKKPRSLQYPELTVLKELIQADSCVLDGEVVAFGPNDRPYFPEVLKRDRVQSVNKQLIEHVPIIYILFDIIFLNGKWLLRTPLKDRQHLLQSTIQTNEYVHICDNYPSGRQLFNAVQQQNMEGIVAKQLDGHYYIERKHHTWKKIKNWRTLKCVVGGVTLREHQVNALLLGIQQNDSLYFIGRAASGLTRDDVIILTDLASEYAIGSPLFINPPSFNRIQTKWLPPGIHATVRFIEWTTHGRLRSPTIVKLGT